LVAIPPFVLSLKVGSRIICASFVAFACTGRSPVPYPFGLSVVDLLLSVEPVGIYTLLEFEILFKVDKSLLDAFFYTNFQNLLISFLCLSFNVLTRRLDTEFPWSF